MTAIICLGGSFSNKQQFINLKLRIEKAVELYKKRKGARIIFTGGFSKTADFSEAKLIADIAQSIGVSQKDIILEEKADNTIQNAINSKRILEEEGFDAVVVVTSPIHLRRAKYIFRKIIPDRKLEFVSSENHLGLAKRITRNIIEILKLGPNSISLLKHNFNEN